MHAILRFIFLYPLLLIVNEEIQKTYASLCVQLGVNFLRQEQSTLLESKLGVSESGIFPVLKFSKISGLVGVLIPSSSCACWFSQRYCASHP